MDGLNKIPGDKCFIITDKGVINAGLLDILTAKLKDLDKEWMVFDEVEPDPHEDTLIRAAEICREYNPNLIIGLGGGSSLDTAKGVWFLYENEGKNLDDLNPFEQIQMGIKAKCVAIPTTAGTGAETTWAVIITRIDAEGHHSKLEQAHRDVVPTYALIDPIFTMGLPPKLTAATGFDAIAHCCEAIISGWRNDISDGLALHALDLIRQNLIIAYQDGSNKEARSKMATAATLAGLAFGNSQVVLGHAIGHSLGAVFQLTHGITVGMMLPYIIEFCINDEKNDFALKAFGNAAKRLSLVDKDVDLKSGAQALIAFIRDMQIQLNFPTNLQECGVTQEMLDEQMERIIQLTNESASAAMTPRFRKRPSRTNFTIRIRRKECGFLIVTIPIVFLFFLTKLI